MLQRLVHFCRRRPVLFLGLASLGAVVLALLHLGWVARAAERTEPGRGAAWIWAEEAAAAAKPVAFWAVRDFTIEDPAPLVDPSVVIVADESYELWLNGRRVGSGAYAPGGAAHRYGVGDLLQSGLNRLLVEARSGRGAGGLLVTLRAGERVLLGTDASWRIVRRARPQLLAGSFLGSEVADPKVWKHSSTGRFRVAGIEERDVAERSAVSHDPQARARRQRHLSDVSWQDLTEHHRRIPARQAVFDFGEEVTGYLSLDFAEEGDTGLLYFGLDEPVPQERRPDAVVSPMEGRRSWRDAVPRRFRYVATVGLPALRSVRVDPAGEGVEPVPGRSTPLAGVFGLPPAKPYSPVEEAVWDRLRSGDEPSPRAPAAKGSSAP